MHIYSDGKYIYSVDIMIKYINEYKPKYVKIDMSILEHNLEYPIWITSKGEKYSPSDMIIDIKNSKYKNDIIRIKNADLSYPIIINKGYVVDGIHRLTKAYIKRLKHIKAYAFPSKLMNKFIIGESHELSNVMKLDDSYINEIYNKEFKNE